MLKNNKPSIALSGHIAFALKDGDKNITQLNKKSNFLLIPIFL